MKPVIIIGFFLSLVLGSSTGVLAKGQGVHAIEFTSYFLNGAEVGRREFEGFLRTLTPIEDTDHCKKTIFGGVTSYDAENRKGKRYNVKKEDGEFGHRETIDAEP